jgi:transposase
MSAVSRRFQALRHPLRAEHHFDTVVSKYCNHTPLHRQSVILERDIGLQISRATLDGWVLRVGELLIPMVAAMRRELISGSYIQADETPVDVQTREGRGKNHQAYLWQYGCPRGSVVFDFRLGRGRDGPKRFLGQFEGILQTDGYAAYDQIGGTRMVHAACWAHARRQFFEAVQLNPRDPVATPIVARMDELFAVDVEARHKALTAAVRHVRRQETAKPLLDEIRSKIERSAVDCIARQSTQQGLPVRAHALEETYTISGISGT